MSLVLSTNESSKARTPIFWPGELPEHWRVKRLKFVVKLIKQKAVYEDYELPYMGLEHIEPWTGRYIEDEEASPDGLVGFFEPDDVLLGKLRPYLAKVHLAKHRGVCSTEALVLRTSEDLIPEYLRYFLVAPTTIGNINSSTYGSKMPRASWDFIGNQLQPLPPIDEQRAIADFLDRKTAEIDTLIAKKRRLLDLLAEKRIALITRAVTKGLNPDAPMKDSGIEWLGEIPAHWVVAQVRRVLNRVEQGWSPACEDRSVREGEWGVLKSGCVNGGNYDESEHKALPLGLEARRSLLVKPGDILMCRASGSPHLIGSVAQVQETNQQLMFSDKTYRLTIEDQIMHSDFFVRSMASKYLREQIILSISGAEGLANNIPQSAMKGYLICIPPLTEQIQIMEQIGKEDAWIAGVEEKINLAIDRLLEYRSALITNAVTGQIKVA